MKLIVILEDNLFKRMKRTTTHNRRNRCTTPIFGNNSKKPLKNSET